MKNNRTWFDFVACCGISFDYDKQLRGHCEISNASKYVGFRPILLWKTSSKQYIGFSPILMSSDEWQ